MINRSKAEPSPVMAMSCRVSPRGEGGSMSSVVAIMKGIYPDMSSPFEVNMSRARGVVVEF